MKAHLADLLARTAALSPAPATAEVGEPQEAAA